MREYSGKNTFNSFVCFFFCSPHDNGPQQSKSIRIEYQIVIAIANNQSSDIWLSHANIAIHLNFDWMNSVNFVLLLDISLRRRTFYTVHSCTQLHRHFHMNKCKVVRMDVYEICTTGNQTRTDSALEYRQWFSFRFLFQCTRKEWGAAAAATTNERALKKRHTELLYLNSDAQANHNKLICV